MKKTISPLLPALALLTLGSCAGTSALTSTTENDGIYYSSQDRTTAAPQASTAAPAPASAQAAATNPGNSSGDVANPDYADNSTARANGNTEYYDDDYYASRLRRFHQPYYRGMGLGYYDFAYTDPFWYGGSSFYAPYSYWGPTAWGPTAYYDPFFGPTWGGSYVSINLGFGRPWYRPWNRYGYGAYGYSPYDYYSSPWGSPWGYGGLGYGYGYNSYGGYYSAPGGFSGVNRPNVSYGPRRDRSTEAIQAGADGRLGNTTGTTGRGRVEEGGIVDPTGGNPSVAGQPQPSGGRRRVEEVSPSGGVLPPASTTDVVGAAPENGRRRVREEQPLGQPAGGTTTIADQPTGGRRWRVLSEGTSPAPDQPRTNEVNTEPARRRRFWDAADNGGQPARASEPVQPRPRLYESNDQPSRSFSEPSRSYSPPARSYSEPSRSFSEPSRSISEPSRSFSEPSRSFSSPSSGGGGGRRGRVE